MTRVFGFHEYEMKLGVEEADFERDPRRQRARCLISPGSLGTTFEGLYGRTAQRSVRADCSPLLEHLVGTAEDRRRDRQAKLFGGLQVDDEFDDRQLNHRQVGGFLATEDLAGIDAGLATGPSFTR